MAQLIGPISVPDAKLQLVLDGWATEHGYMATFNGVPNPETKLQFFRRTLIAHVGDVARKHYVPPDVGIT